MDQEGLPENEIYRHTASGSCSHLKRNSLVLIKSWVSAGGVYVANQVTALLVDVDGDPQGSRSRYFRGNVFGNVAEFEDDIWLFFPDTLRR